ncbi:hypothetical protein H8356DRAFT_1434804 [Neocallimastix lanati (nom. inval.)]|nr:hypothetical protein H8356DRAFT_1434804 [Neocallimastix sp. JGI-2020a]
MSTYNLYVDYSKFKYLQVVTHFLFIKVELSLLDDLTDASPIQIRTTPLVNQIFEYDDSHNHLENKFGAAKSIVKNKIKDEISNSPIPFNVNIKRKYDEISQGMGLIHLGYNSIKFQVTKSRRKQLPPDITTFDEIPNESKYYITKN